MANTANFKLGHAAVTVGGTDIGHTKGGVEVTINKSFVEGMVDKYGETPVKVWDTGTRIEIKAFFAESDLTKIALSTAGVTTVTGTTVDELNFGKIAGNEITGVEIVITPIHATAPADVWTFYKCVPISSPTFAYKIDEETVYEVSWVAIIDETKTDGNYLGQFGTSD